MNSPFFVKGVFARMIAFQYAQDAQDFMDKPLDVLMETYAENCCNLAYSSPDILAPIVQSIETLLALKGALKKVDLSQAFDIQLALFHFNRINISFIAPLGVTEKEILSSATQFLVEALDMQQGIMYSVYHGDFPSTETCQKMGENMIPLLDDLLTYALQPLFIDMNDTLENIVQDYVFNGLIQPTHIDLSIACTKRGHLSLVTG